ncbi:dTDP-4-dehydrorhamnose reductase [Steroidobacter sp.]|uniref:dTDP-4-dehydrorhamnose reductase n=1 Tax=Steroidobacter sp. TaxID=1978227 RepID=UPI001A3684BA|nr:dTDP-4-dehydrorhamnose reductase [Steroidobacter sp.]MBL8271015.1 dTDP-4-dehydrorhamnose reductase [Steroidobacter sp.]
MKVLIVGAAGQLGRALVQSAPASIELIAWDRAQLDLSQLETISARVHAARPDVLSNAAAYTAVDQAESDSQRAYLINAEAVGVLGEACAAAGTRLVHVSTDFVFDGAAGRPYQPNDVTAPLGVYGASKVAGEKRLATQTGLNGCVVRTAWVYSSVGKNFLLTMLRLFKERPVVRVVADQIGTPTSAKSLASCLWSAAVSEVRGILHFTDAGAASWYDFAVAIYEEAQALGLLTQPVDIQPIRTSDYPTPARRPSYSVLDVSATRATLGLQAIHWRAQLREVLRELRS